ncbi:MAG: VOC family protein [Pleurocapsa minor GSE-CHR-MK-17-07R]|jgi:catechol 2,3-dioxygenase-like lactoylglutathione lyase family enzyme|nr:VOC family protein [Pleurocapsa minor GSE-CHR-MK 17-07R]
MPVFELRVALTVDDFEKVTSFYRDGLGLEPGDLWTNAGNGQIFFAGRGTLEVFDHAHADAVDQLEVGQRVSGQIRFAFEVPDVHAAVERALAYGATLVHPPKLTPWNDLNARLLSPEGLQVTLFQPIRD